jgi:ribosome-binding factor A
MKKNPSRRQLLSSCTEIGQDDGVDPRTFFRKSTRQRTNRKAVQLCAEVARTLSCLLGGESGDELLRSTVVESVQPAPDSTRVLVTVSIQAPAGTEIPRVLERLHHSSGWLRSEVAAAIHRKRVPELVFRVVGGAEVNHD